jgi:hypothetical protein
MCGHLWPVPDMPAGGRAGALAGAVVVPCVEVVIGVELVVLRVDVLLGADPLVDASATPALPAPTPAASTAVRTSRRIRRGDPGLVVRNADCLSLRAREGAGTSPG